MQCKGIGGDVTEIKWYDWYVWMNIMDYVEIYLRGRVKLDSRAVIQQRHDGGLHSHRGDRE